MADLENDDDEAVLGADHEENVLREAADLEEQQDEAEDLAEERREAIEEAELLIESELQADDSTVVIPVNEIESAGGEDQAEPEPDAALEVTEEVG